MTTSSDKRRVFEGLTDVFVDEGVTTAFGLMGDDTAALTADMVERGGIEYFAARHENAAVGMAEGFAWATDELAVSVISRGPGMANALTAATTAGRGGRPVLIVSGDFPLQLGAYRPDLKGLDTKAFATMAGLESFHTTLAGEAPTILREAIRSSLAGRPALFSVPADVLHGPLPEIVTGDRGSSAQPSVALPDAENVRRVVELLDESSRPVILAGRGAMRPETIAKLEALAARCGALLATTLPANAAFHASPFNLGISGGFAVGARRELLTQADIVLAFGASLSSFTTSERRLYANARVVHVDTDSATLGTNQPVDVAVLGDADATAAALLELLGADTGGEKPFHHPDVLAQLTMSRHDGSDIGTEGEVDPRLLTATLDELLPDDRTVVSDGGAFMGFPGIYLQTTAPNHLRITAEFAAVGMGIGIAMGAAVARRPRVTCLAVGDGGMLMTCGELETIARYRLPVIVLVLNDRAYGAERDVLSHWGVPDDVAKFPDTDFAAVAAGFGIESHTITSIEQLRALAPDLAQRHRPAPLLLDCKIKPKVDWYAASYGLPHG